MSRSSLLSALFNLFRENSMVLIYASNNELFSATLFVESSAGELSIISVFIVLTLVAKFTKFKL